MWLRKSKKGFTLIELMVVVAIIGVLVLLGLRAYSAQKERAMNSIVKANASTIQTMLVGAMADRDISTTSQVEAAIRYDQTAAVIEQMVNPYNSLLSVYRVETSTDSSSWDGASEDYKGRVSIMIDDPNILLLQARGKLGETLLTYPLPANKY